MTNHSRPETHVEALLSGYIDGELTQGDRQRVRVHCEACEQCSKQLAELQSLRAAVGGSRLSEISHDIWREAMRDTTVKATRGIGWLLLVGGLLLAAGLAIYEFLRDIGSMPPIVVLIVIGIYGGALLLFVSVLRQRLVERRTDKYKDVEI